jgi:hypothetical protein
VVITYQSRGLKVFSWDVFSWDVFSWDVFSWDVFSWDVFSWDVFSWDVIDVGFPTCLVLINNGQLLKTSEVNGTLLLKFTQPFPQ